MGEFYEPIETFKVELASDLASDKDFIDKLFKEIDTARENHFKEFGVIVPKIKTYINSDLQIGEYTISISDVPAEKFILKTGSLLAINTGYVINQIDGEKAKEPAFQCDSVWIPSEKEEKAKNLGYKVASHHKILTVHLFEIIRQNQDLLITTKYVHNLLEACKKEDNYLTEEFKERFDTNYITTLKQVIQNLVEELFPIRDIKTILETLCNSSKSKEILELTNKTRLAIVTQAIYPYCDNNNVLKTVKLSDILISNISNIYNYQHNKIIHYLKEALKTSPIFIVSDSYVHKAYRLISNKLCIKNCLIITKSELLEIQKRKANIIIETRFLHIPEEEFPHTTFAEKETIIEQIENSDVIIINENENIAVGLRYDKEKEEPKFLFANNNLDEIKKISSEYELVFTNACAPDLAKDLFDEYQQDQKSIPESSYKSISKIYANLHKKGLWCAN